MKTLKKSIAVAGLSTVCAISLFAGASMLATDFSKAANAETSNAPDAKAYFYNILKDEKGNEYTLAKKFYQVLDEMNKSGDFKDGKVEYSLDNILTSEQIKGWVENGDVTVPKAYSAGRDAYMTDHPELFYIDYYKLTISAGRSGGVYKAYLDCGREANIYRDDGFTNEEDVDKAIAAFNAEVDKIAAEAVEASENALYGTAKEVVQAKYVNKYFAENTEYDFGALDEYQQTGTSTASMIFTAYGSLITHKAVCSGYSTGYKAVMDKLNIPTLVVSGYSVAKNSKGEYTEKGEAHSWNYVWLEDPVEDETPARAARAEGDGGAWYAVDTTWNSTGNNNTKYMLVGRSSFSKEHIAEGIISSSGYELVYPELAKYNYGCKTASNGIIYSINYEESPSGELDNYGNPVYITKETVSYNGKGATKLYEEDNLYLAVRYAKIDAETQKVVWTVWQALVPLVQNGVFPALDDDGTQVTMPGNASNLYVQYAVFDEAPDIDYNPDDYHPDKPAWAPDGYVHLKFNFAYDYKDEPGDKMTAATEIIQNECYGTYVPAPIVNGEKTTPSIMVENILNDNTLDRNSDKPLMAEKHAINYNIVYMEKLHILDENKEVGISVTTQHRTNTMEYARLVPFEDGKLVHFDGDRTISFKFCPSLMYEHNMEHYTFTFTNIGSGELRTRPVRDDKGNIVYDENGEIKIENYTSDKLPSAVSFSYGRLYNACPKYFNYDGRLYVNCCAQPTLVSNEDLSEMNFQDEEGNSTFSEQERSQMMLVVDTVNKKTEQAMLDGIDGNDELIDTKDIKASETYDINLQICGKYPKIPDGSYVKIALGFPEGYGPGDEGVTFKLFHRKHIKGDEYIIEEVPCVVTKQGIIATVTSFSPYMVAAVDADKATTKNIVASIDGRGGKLSKEDGEIKTLKAGESCTYTISPDAGYKIYSVKLNDKEISARVGADGKLTLTYDELTANNELDIQYISNEASARFEDKGLEYVAPLKVVLDAVERPGFTRPGDFDDGPVINPDPDDGKDDDEANIGTPGDIGGGDKKDNTVAIVIAVVSVVVVVGLAVAAVIVILKRKKQ